MNDLTDRQRVVLELIIREYIQSASPISSKFIEKEYDLGISPATIRGEMHELIEKGYLFQPHTSAGRMPTDKGYRFFVDLLSYSEAKHLEKQLERKIRQMQREIGESIHFIREFTRFLAHTSSALTISYFPKENILLKEGWAEAFRDPEFTDIEKIHDFMGMISDFEDHIDAFLLAEKMDSTRVYIGKECPLSEKHDFSVLLSPCKMSKKKGILAIMGPKRMPYDKNIYLVESIIKILEE